MNACKMISFVLFPFPDKINEPNISKLFVYHFQFALNLKTLICSILPKTQHKLILGRESTHLQFTSIYF